MDRENEFTLGSPHLLYVYFRDKGTFGEISQYAIDRLITYASFANGSGTGADYLIPAEYALETGDWEAAELNSFKAIYKAGTKEQSSIIICANFTLIRLYILQGKVFEAVEMLKQLEKDISEVNSSIYNTTIDMCRGYIYSCLAQPEKIPSWLQMGDMAAANFFYQGVAFNYIVYGKAVMLSKNYIALEILSESFKEHFSIFSNRLGFIHNQIFDAVAKYNLYGLKEGTASLKKALEMGEADNIIMPFVEDASAIMGMLQAILQSDSENEYIRKVMLFSQRYLEGLKSCQLSKVKLSQREIEILSLTADGLKREEIAARLHLSPGTVKTHLQNIYQKLDVSGKTSAIKAAGNMGLF